jgi:hypothetical protein
MFLERYSLVLIPSIGIGSSRYSDRLEKPGNLLKNRHQLRGSTSMNTAVEPALKDHETGFAKHATGRSRGW